MKYLMLIGLSLLFLARAPGQAPHHPFDYERVNPQATVVGSRSVDSLIQMEKIVLDGFGTKIPLYHFRNKRQPESPYVILLHGLGGNKRYWVYPGMPYLSYTQNLTTIKDSLLSLGFNLIIPDAPFHGERSYELDFRDPGALPPGFSKDPTDAQLFYDLAVASVKEVQLIMDYFQQRNPDADFRFNLLGYSMGAAVSLFVNTLDDRLNSVVACVPPISRPYSELEALGWTGEIARKMKTISPMYAATNQQAPVVMLMGKTDFFIPLQEAKTFFARIPVADKDLTFYDSGHELPAAYIADAIAWIQEHNDQ